jgi:hypothetical protein
MSSVAERASKRPTATAATSKIGSASGPGQYVITVALTRAGALADGVVGPGDILVLQTSQFTVGP